MVNRLEHLGIDARYTMLGFTEGIIVALGLGGQALIDPSKANPGNVILNAGVISAAINLTTSAFTELYQERMELLEIERRMVISQRGHYLGTGLYRLRRRRAAQRAVTFGVAAFVGAATLLPAVALFPGEPWLGLVLPLSCLFALGFTLGRRSAGAAFIWGVSLTLAGAIVGILGLFFPA